MTDSAFIVRKPDDCSLNHKYCLTLILAVELASLQASSCKLKSSAMSSFISFRNYLIFLLPLSVSQDIFLLLEIASAKKKSINRAKEHKISIGKNWNKLLGKQQEVCI